ncbi:FecR family protein [Sphingobacterium sp. SGG-5]|uniref:FecR family protein n=1 Tax=Sphingobacterium sp. SGG-5 TaxID=2710881 RepID=UPI0013EA144C|nr:FecR family protein [Sphingobacterium sp. SGG-5]NGM61232.1 FecR family protein [Sphingobacterium sp. SGG-5]
MKKEDLYNLIRKYNAGLATDEEKHILEQWYDKLQIPLSEAEEATVRNKGEQVLRRLQAQNIASKKPIRAIRPVYRWIGVACAVAALLLLIGYPFFQGDNTQDVIQNIGITNIIPPGGTKAELILPDGKRVDVSALDEKKIQELYSALATNQSFSSSDESDNKYELVVPKGGEFQFVLPDGTKVWMNAHSKLSFSDFDQQSERRVALQGEAYFEVAKNKSKPFYVDTKDAQVRVLGTHFNVRAYENQTRTTLLEGSVSFSNQLESIVLKPGQFGENSDSKLKTGIADISREIAWKNDEFYFKEDNITYITRQLERWYDITVAFDTGISMQTGYTGRIKRTATLQEVVEMLNYVMDVKMEIKGNKLFVERK